MPGSTRILQLAPLLLLFLFTSIPMNSHAQQKQTWTIGFFSQTPEIQARAWQPLTRYLARSLPGAKFRLKSFSSREELSRAVRNRQIDFFISNPVNTGRIQMKYRVRLLATLISGRGRFASPYTGVTLFTRSTNTGINSINDFRGKYLVAPGINRSSSWWIQLDILRRHGIDPYQNMKSIRSEDNKARLVREVISGRADIGVVANGTLEALAATKQIDLKSVKVINRQRVRSYAFMTSSHLFPGWAFASLRQVPGRMSDRVAVALIKMKPDMPAARIAGYSGWTLPGDYARVRLLLTRLDRHHREIHQSASWSETLLKLLPWIASALLVIGLFGLLVRRIQGLGRRLILTERDLKETSRMVEDIAARDSLTSLVSRHKLDEHLDHEWWRACRERKPISAIIVGFKSRNPLDAPNSVLIQIAECIQDTFKRTVDIKARYSESEFLVVLPDTDNENANRLANSLQETTNDLIRGSGNSGKLPATTVGVATMIPEQNSIPETLIAAADRALYQARLLGTIDSDKAIIQH